jgi:hypothetical protein
MPLANDMTLLINKIERRLGLAQLVPHLPENLGKEKWAEVINQDTMVTFSRYYPNRFPLVVNDDTCHKETINGVVWYYIKDEILDGVKLLGLMDIDWMDHTTANSSLGATSLGGGYYYPSFACPQATFESVLALQMNADMASLYNRGIYIDFQYPNRFSLKGLANTNYDLNTFTVILLVEHRSLSTISPTKMEVFESLAQADVANFLYMNLRYFDGFETAYVNIDLKLSELQDAANKRESILEEIQNSYVSTSNDNIPYIWTV